MDLRALLRDPAASPSPAPSPAPAEEQTDRGGAQRFAAASGKRPARSHSCTHLLLSSSSQVFGSTSPRPPPLSVEEPRSRGRGWPRQGHTEGGVRSQEGHEEDGHAGGQEAGDGGGCKRWGEGMGQRISRKTFSKRKISHVVPPLESRRGCRDDQDSPGQVQGREGGEAGEGEGREEAAIQGRGIQAGRYWSRCHCGWFFFFFFFFY